VTVAQRAGAVGGAGQPQRVAGLLDAAGRGGGGCRSAPTRGGPAGCGGPGRGGAGQPHRVAGLLAPSCL